MNILRIAILFSLCLISAGCSYNEQPPEPNEAVEKPEKKVSSTVSTTRIPKQRCRKIPPVNRAVIISSLKQRGMLTPAMTQEQQDKVINEYLAAQRERYKKSC